MFDSMMEVLLMKVLEERILKDGKVLPGEVLKVGSFLNQQIDTSLMCEMGKEIAKEFADAGVTKVMTIETSGIPLAMCTALAMNVPVVYGKKHRSNNLSGEMLTAQVFSYTNQTEYTIILPKDYVSKDDVILMVDDFLASGNAYIGMLELVSQVGAKVAGMASGIEKGFQGGGDKLRKMGYKVVSLANIDSMSEDSLTFRA